MILDFTELQNVRNTEAHWMALAVEYASQKNKTCTSEVEKW